MSTTFTAISAYILATFLILAGIAHFIYPKVFKPLFFDFIPVNIRYLLIYLSGAAELLLALGLLLPEYRELSAGLVFVMLVLYLPLHIRDVFIDRPVVGTKLIALLRLLLQFGLLYWVSLIGSEKII